MATKYYVAKTTDGRILNVFRTHSDDNMKVEKVEYYNYEFGWCQDDLLLQRFQYYGDFEVFDHENDEVILEKALEIIKKLDEEYAAMKATQQKE